MYLLKPDDESKKKRGGKKVSGLLIEVSTSIIAPRGEI